MDEINLNVLNKLIIHPDFKGTLSEIKKLNPRITKTTIDEQVSFDLDNIGGGLVEKIEKEEKYLLKPKAWEKLVAEGNNFLAYDESINKFGCLEGNAVITSHSLVMLGKQDYIPSCFITFYFYTHSQEYKKNSRFIKYSAEADIDSKRDYLADRTRFILDTVPKDSILFIDGPLLGGQSSGYTIKMNEELLNRDILPIFFVKNSSSNLVIDNYPSLKGKYNSDMDWSFKFLKEGERTAMFRYKETGDKEQGNPNHVKVFCYIKAHNVSPVRVELHPDTLRKYSINIDNVLNSIYYLILVQGDLKNPQVRPVAIAEKYARETLKLFDIDKLMREAGVVPTMNQERFAW
jgi:hypothetical protein